MDGDLATDKPGPMGWGVDESRLKTEQALFGALSSDDPVLFSRNPIREPISQRTLDAVKAEQAKDGIDGGISLRHIEPVVFGGDFLEWLKQLIGSCFKPGTLIRMADGSHKPIEQLRLFEQVLTAEGNIGHVSQLFGRHVDEPIYSIKLWGHRAVEMTEEHPLLTKRGYVKACDLTMEDMVAVPRYMPQTNNILLTESHVTLNQQMRRRIAKGELVGSHKALGKGGVEGVRQTVKVYRSVPDAIELTEEFGWLIGVALAEGGTDGNKVVFTFHPDEFDTLAERVVKAFRNLFGVEASKSMQTRPGKRLAGGGREAKPKTCKVVVHSVAWASCFDSWIGKRPEGKRLHADLTSGPVQFLKGVWDGWIAGDGYEGRQGQQQGTTVSRQLAHDMHAIANALGMYPCINRTEPQASHGVTERQPRYDVCVYAQKGIHLNCEEDERTVWRKVRGIEQVHYTGRVYNFEVHGDNSYVADGLGVHNCVGSAGMRCTSRRMLWESFVLGDPEEIFGTKLPGRDSFAPFAPYHYRAGRKIGGLNSGDGSFCSAQIKGMKEWGLLPCSAPGLESDAFPEPQNTSTYRRYGNSDSFLRQFAPVAKQFRLLESEKVSDADTLKVLVTEHFKPVEICSMWAFTPDYTHSSWKLRDGQSVVIYKRDRRTSWAHAMSIIAVVEHRGKWFAIIENSWGNAHKNGTWFAVPMELMAQWLPDAEAMSIGDIEMTDNVLAA